MGARREACNLILPELTPEQKSNLSSYIYRKFKVFYESSTLFRRLNPQAFLAPYASCYQCGGAYVLLVRSMTELTSGLTDEFRAAFDYCLECEGALSVMAGSTDAKFMVPMWLPVPMLFPVLYGKKIQQVPPQTWADSIDRLFSTNRLMALGVALCLLFFVLFVLYKVPDEDKVKLLRSLVQWALPKSK
jgi:hypothetical protein